MEETLNIEYIDRFGQERVVERVEKKFALELHQALLDAGYMVKPIFRKERMRNYEKNK